MRASWKSSEKSLRCVSTLLAAARALCSVHVLLLCSLYWMSVGADVAAVLFVVILALVAFFLVLVAFVLVVLVVLFLSRTFRYSLARRGFLRRRLLPPTSTTSACAKAPPALSTWTQLACPCRRSA